MNKLLLSLNNFRWRIRAKRCEQACAEGDGAPPLASGTHQACIRAVGSPGSRPSSPLGSAVLRGGHLDHQHHLANPILVRLQQDHSNKQRLRRMAHQDECRLCTGMLLVKLLLRGLYL